MPGSNGRDHTIKGSSNLSLLERIQGWVAEPPPEYLVEVSEHGLAWMPLRDPGSGRVEPFSERALTASPTVSNITRPDLLQAALPKTGNGSSQRKPKAAMVIPDYATRMAVLDFEEFPADAEQRLALVRFRLRKSVPFPIDEAQVSCSVQVQNPAQKRIEVLAAAVAQPVLNEYEEVLRRAGFHVGIVVPSSLAALTLCARQAEGLTIVAKLCGGVISVILLEEGKIRLVRCLDFSSGEEQANDAAAVVTTLLQQTIAYAEDELGHQVHRLLLCGFGQDSERLGESLEREFDLPWEPLQSRFGPVGQENAGLLGLLEQYAA
jgi:type IV pilus assembly protein PilM